MGIKGKGDYIFCTSFIIKNKLYRNIDFGNYDVSLQVALSHYFFGTSALMRWTGSEWIISKLKYYNSTNFVDANLKIWDGTDWISVSTNRNF